MHKAHELLERLRPGGEDFSLIMRAIKFDLGDYETASSLSELSTDTFWTAPFPVCVFQWSEGPRTHLFLTIQDSESMKIKCFYKNEGTNFTWDQSSFDLLIKRSAKDPCSTNMAFVSHPGEDITEWVLDRPDAAGMGWMMVETARCMEVFSCCNVMQVEHKAPRFINKKRQQKNKPPIFSYRTLHICGDQDEKESSASRAGRPGPRLHMRRGHIRRIAGGRRIWVRSAIVGDKSKGFVHKDYAITLPPSAPPSPDRD